MLEIRDVSKSYGDVIALDRVSLDVEAGEICCLLGPNGAGKTTLVSIVAGLRRADSGRVTVAGVDPMADPGRARRSIGLAPQELGVYPSLEVRENLAFFEELAHGGGPATRRRVEEMAETLQLTPLLDRPVQTLSGGEKRRVHAAMAMLHEPPLLLLDEPTTGVDVQTRALVLEAVRRLADHGCAVCYSTHYLHEVESLGASVAIIDAGRIIARGPVGEVVSRYGTTAIELGFDGPAPALDGRWRSDVVDATTVRVYTERPSSELGPLLSEMGPATDRLRAVEIVSTSLESVFLTLTGRRYETEIETEEASDVVAA